MDFEYYTLADCPPRGEIQRADVVYVVIDVIRAFTTACFAFAAGAQEILLVGSVGEAIARRAERPGSLAIGEVDGLKAPGFDYGNSPAEFMGGELTGRRLIQRTSAGTQGMMAVRSAERIVGASFVCAKATALLIRSISPKKAAFVITGLMPDGRGDEDLACAEYLQQLLMGENPDPEPYLTRVRTSINADKLRTSPLDAPGDVELCADLDRFDFGLQVKEVEGHLIMRTSKDGWRSFP